MEAPRHRRATVEEVMDVDAASLRKAEPQSYANIAPARVTRTTDDAAHKALQRARPRLLGEGASKCQGKTVELGEMCDPAGRT